jgi:hypothetical protein
VPGVGGERVGAGERTDGGEGAVGSEAGEPCDEGDRYRCTGSRVFDCASSLPIGRCVRGCFAEGASIDDGDVAAPGVATSGAAVTPINREAAFAILCSR